MPILRKFKRKEKGVEETVHLGALAQNITQDATHRFVTDVEKQAWNSKPGSTSGLDNNVVTFTEAATRENLQSGEKLSISLGKIKKWFSDLGAAAFMAVANNCTTTQPGSVLAAEQGKKLQDQISQVSSETDRIRVYVGSDGKLHFVNKAGADTVIPFDSYPYPDITISGYGSDAGTTITKPYGYNFIRCDSIRGNAYIHVDGVANKVETGNILDISSASSLELDFQIASFTIYK